MTRPAPIADRPAVVAFLDQGHTAFECAKHFGYTLNAIRDVEGIEARHRAKTAASRARIEARNNPPPEVVAQIVAFFNEGRVEFEPGVIARLHNRRELYAKFDAYDRNALDRIVRGAR